MFLFLGSVIAWLALIIGGLRFAAGIYVASIDDAAMRAAYAKRYLGSTAAMTEGIDQGLLVFVFGVVLGILVKIGRSVSR